MQLPDSRVRTENQHLDQTPELRRDLPLGSDRPRDVRDERGRQERDSTDVDAVRQQRVDQHHYDADRRGANGG